MKSNSHRRGNGACETCGRSVSGGKLFCDNCLYERQLSQSRERGRQRYMEGYYQERWDRKYAENYAGLEVSAVRFRRENCLMCGCDITDRHYLALYCVDCAELSKQQSMSKNKRERMSRLCPSCGRGIGHLAKRFTHCPTCSKKETTKEKDEYGCWAQDLVDWSIRVRARDNHVCQGCGCNDERVLHAHHMKPKSRFPDLSLDIRNGVTLCANCHTLAHRGVLYDAPREKWVAPDIAASGLVILQSENGGA